MYSIDNSNNLNYSRDAGKFENISSFHTLSQSLFFVEDPPSLVGDRIFQPENEARICISCGDNKFVNE